MNDKIPQEEKNKRTGINDPVLEPPKLGLVKCPNCKEKVEPENGMCPQCQHYLGEGKSFYQPLSEKTTRKVKMILTFVLLGTFIALAVFGVIKLQACQG